MKKIFVFAFAALFMGVSCTQDNLRDDSAPETPATVERVPVTIRAGFGDAVMSRTYLDGHTVKWSAGDQIGIIDAECASSASKAAKAAAIQTFTLTERSADNTSATFSGSITPGLAKYYAVYPYDASDFYNSSDGIRIYFSSTQRGTPGTFVDSYNPAVALLKNGALAFKNLGGLLKIQITSTDIKSIVFRANSETNNIGGVWYVKMNSEGEIESSTLPSGGSRSAITLVPSEGTTFSTGTYYVAVAPGTYTNGLLIKLTLDDDTVTYRNTTSDVVVERSKITNLGSVSGSFKGVTFPVVFNLGDRIASPTGEFDGYNHAYNYCMSEWISASLYGSGKAATTSGTYGKWLCNTQPRAYMTWTWDSAITGTGVKHYLETASTFAQKISSPGIKGIWTGDYFEFTLPLENKLDGGTTIRLSMPLYTRGGPTFWEVQYYDGGVWKSTAQANLPAYTGAAVTSPVPATWALPFGGTANAGNTTNTMQTVDMTFVNDIARGGEVKVRVICVDGSIFSTAANTVTTGNTKPGNNSNTANAPFYFWNPADRDNQAITFETL